MSLNIDQLRLSRNARKGAEWVRDRHPSLLFTSGRRDARDQARVMAWNVGAYGRDWITRTYRASPIIDTLNQWLAAHPTENNHRVITDGFYDCLLACHSGELTSLSRHLTGDAFDAAWPGTDAEGERICEDMRTNMPKEYGLQKVIDREGGLRVIHAQFTASAEA